MYVGSGINVKPVGLTSMYEVKNKFYLLTGSEFSLKGCS